MRVHPIDLVDILVYLVILGAFTQLFPRVISETFLLALLTAILLKVVLELVLWAKKSTLDRARAARTPLGRVVGTLTLLLLMSASKFLVLELTALVFGDAVQLGGFLPVTALILTLMLARAGTRYVLLPRDREPSAH